MKALKFLHAADLHLDSPFKGMNAVPERIRDVIRESTFGALNRLVRLAVREKVDFAVFSGDIYDAGDRSLRAQLRFRSALAELDRAGIPAWLSTAITIRWTDGERTWNGRRELMYIRRTGSRRFGS